MTTDELPCSRHEHLLTPTVHSHLVDLLDAVAAESAPGLSDGLRAELARKLDEHYFDVRRCIGRSHQGSLQDERSIDHLSSALHHLQVANDLAAARQHLIAHGEQCPLATPRTTTTEPPPSEPRPRETTR